MAQLRQQFLRQVAVVAAATSTTTVDITGPETAAAAPYAEGTDHVVDERQVRQNEAGWVTIAGWDGSALDSADISVTVEIWSRGSRAAQKGLEAPLFPSGAATAADPVLKRVVCTAVPGNDDELLSVFGYDANTVNVKVAPALHVRADEFIRLSLANSAGAKGSVTLSAKFDLGINPVDSQR